MAEHEGPSLNSFQPPVCIVLALPNLALAFAFDWALATVFAFAFAFAFALALVSAFAAGLLWRLRFGDIPQFRNAAWSQA